MTDRIAEQGGRDRVLGEAFAAAAAQCSPPITAEAVWNHPSFLNMKPGEHERALHAALDSGLVGLGSKGTSLVVNVARLPEVK